MLACLIHVLNNVYRKDYKNRFLAEYTIYYESDIKTSHTDKK